MHHPSQPINLRLHHHLLHFSIQYPPIPERERNDFPALATPSGHVHARGRSAYCAHDTSVESCNKDSTFKLSGERFPKRVRFLVSIQPGSSATMPRSLNVIVQEDQTDVESGLAQRIIQHRIFRPAPVPGSGMMTDSNSLGFIATALFLYSTVYTHPGAPNFLTGLIGVALATVAILKMYAICYRVFNLGPLVDDYPTVTPPARTGGRYERFLLQLDLLNQDEDDAGEEGYTFTSGVPSGLGIIELNALPVHNYRVPSHPVAAASGSSSSDQASSSSSSSTAPAAENNQNSVRRYGDDDLTCSICLEDVQTGELVRHLPCLHQFHQRCIDTWLRQRGLCPICKASVWRGLLERASIEMGHVDA